MKKILSLASVFLLLLVPVLPAGAALLGVGETYTLQETSPILENVYVAGGTVVLSSPLEADVTVAGGSVTVSGTVSGDALVAGGSVELLGDIGDDVRAAGGKITLARNIAGDVVFAGGAISMLPSSMVAGDVIIAGGSVSLLGNVEGVVYFAGGDIFIDGTIAGNVSIYSAKSVRIGEHAVIGGTLTYRAASEAEIAPSAVITGDIKYTYLTPVLSAPDIKGFFAGLFGVLFVAKLLVLIATTLFFVLVFRRISVKFAHATAHSFWKSILVGFIVLVTVPFVSILLAITIFGSMLSAVTMLFWITLILVSQAYVGVAAASLFSFYSLKRELQPIVSWKAAVLGVIAINVISLIPFIGLPIYFVIFLSSVGALSQLLYQQFLTAR